MGIKQREGALKLLFFMLKLYLIMNEYAAIENIGTETGPLLLHGNNLVNLLIHGCEKWVKRFKKKWGRE